MTRVRLWVAGILAALCIAAVTVAKNKPKTSNAADEHRRAVHALDRLTFGSRPGNADTVSAMGVDKWIELQLDPEKINDSAIEARLEQYRALRMSAREMVTDFPPNPLLKAAMEGKIAKPNEKQAGIRGQATANPAMVVPASTGQTPSVGSPAIGRQQDRRDAHNQVDSLTQLQPDDRMRRILSLPASEQA